MATAHSCVRRAATRPSTVPTTRLPSCIGSHRIQYSQPGSPLTARNTRASQGGMSGRRAAPMEHTVMTRPTPESQNQP
jgi:hypothetical protein